MGLKSIQMRWWAILILILVPLLVVGCNRSAPEPEELEQVEDAPAAEEISGQTMPTTEETADGESAESAAEEPAVAETTAEEPAVAETVAEEPTVAETVAEEPVLIDATPDSERAYVILPGDTLFSIGQSYGVTVEEIAARNSILNVHQIDVGQQIIIPVAGAAPAEPSPGTPGAGERVHVVRAGENLFRISLAYNMSFETVAAYNNIPWPYQIYPGQGIRIPATE